MSRRNYGPLGMADLLVRKRASKRMDRLARIDDLVDWQAVDRLFERINSARMGAPGYPPLCLFKALLLGGWHNLSDPELEDAIADRLSFRRFVGIPLDETTPDETSFVRFREKLRAGGLYEKLFDLITCQLEAKGLMLKKGTLVAATVVEADAKRPGSRANKRRKTAMRTVEPQIQMPPLRMTS